MATPTFYLDGHTPKQQDTKLRVFQKILGALIDGGGGGGGGTNTNLDGVVDPTVAPSDITKTWYYTNTVSGSFWIWPANGAAWQQLV